MLVGKKEKLSREIIVSVSRLIQSPCSSTGGHRPVIRLWLPCISYSTFTPKEVQRREQSKQAKIAKKVGCRAQNEQKL